MDDDKIHRTGNTEKMTRRDAMTSFSVNPSLDMNTFEDVSRWIPVVLDIFTHLLPHIGKAELEQGQSTDHKEDHDAHG